MLILTNAGTDKLQVISSSAASLDVHASWADLVSGTVTPGRTNTAISSATTTDVVATPAASTTRNVKTLHIRNKSATLACDVTVVFNQNGTSFELHKVTLAIGDTLEYIEGIGFFVITSDTSVVLDNESGSDQTGFAADTYLAGSSIVIPAGWFMVGSLYELYFDVVKTGAGTATPALSIRLGTLGTTGDTARCTFTFGAGTAAIDRGLVHAYCSFRAVGSGTTAVLMGIAELRHQLASTGLTSTGTSGYAELNSLSAGFDSTTPTVIGASWNGGTSAAHTIELVRASLLR